ncbi:UNVERIFIED_CONTAM: hypothetical protein FKN15_025355 [Acipenser sinensis]
MQDPAHAAQLPLPAQSAQQAQPQLLLPQSLTSPIPSTSSAPQVTFNQLQTLLQPIIDSQLARLDKLENPSPVPPAFSSTPAYTSGPRQRDVSAYQGFYERLLQKSQMLGTFPISSRGAALRVITLISVFGCWVLCPWDVRHRRPQSVTSLLSCPRLLGPSPLGCVGIVALSQRSSFLSISVAGSSTPGMCGIVALIHLTYKVESDMKTGLPQDPWDSRGKFCGMGCDGSDIERENRDCLPYQFEPYASKSEGSNSERDSDNTNEDRPEGQQMAGESGSWQHGPVNKNPYV